MILNFFVIPYSGLWLKYHGPPDRSAADSLLGYPQIFLLFTLPTLNFSLLVPKGNWHRWHNYRCGTGFLFGSAVIYVIY